MYASPFFASCMNKLPFSIAPAAAEKIIEKLAFGNTPTGAGLVPALFLLLDYQCADESGRVFERYRSPSFDIGWNGPQETTDFALTPIEILGHKLFIMPDALEELSPNKRDKPEQTGQV